MRAPAPVKPFSGLARVGNGPCSASWGLRTPGKRCLAWVDFWKTEHSHIERRGRDFNALGGFEKSGHFFFNASAEDDGRSLSWAA